MVRSIKRKVTARLRIGTSGYQYDHWRGVFYPEDLPKKRWFEHYASVFDTVEINNTFYRLPEAHTFQAWHDRTPPGFCYSLKFSRYATHRKRLLEPAEPVHRFLSRAAYLDPLIGAILVQLPPHWHANPQRLEAFLQQLPKERRWAVEVRDPSWLQEEVYSVLERYRAALCIHDMIPDHPARITAPWVYLRYHGSHYGGSYSSEQLRSQARLISVYLNEGLDVFAYFNNDQAGFAVQNALELREFLTHYLRKSN